MDKRQLPAMVLKSAYTTEELLSRVRRGENLSRSGELLLVALLGFPAILSQLSHIVMQYIDASMVGHLGANEAASIGLVTPTLWLFWGMCGVLTTGFSVQVAHRVGAGDDCSARSVLRQALTVCCSLSSAIAVMAVLIRGRLPYWLGGGEDIAAAASAYFGIFAFALPIVNINWLASSMLRCSGNIKAPSILNMAMCLLDIVFNFFLIFPVHTVSVAGFSFSVYGAGMGVAGAALGTAAANIVVATLMLWLLCVRSPHLRLIRERGSFVPSLACLKRAFSISLPIAFERLLMTGAQITTTIIVAPLGVIAIAAHSFAITAESVCYMPGYGVGEAATTLVGQSIGAGRDDLARRFAGIAVVAGMAVMAAMGAAMYVSAPVMMTILSGTEDVVNLGVEILRIEAWAEPMFAAAIVCHCAFVGAGDTLVPSLMNLASMWFIRITLAWQLAGHWGLKGVWTAMCIELCLRGFIFLSRLRWASWTKKHL